MDRPPSMELFVRTIYFQIIVPLQLAYSPVSRFIVSRAAVRKEPLTRSSLTNNNFSYNVSNNCVMRTTYLLG